jgi:hypothetical protein
VSQAPTGIAGNAGAATPVRSAIAHAARETGMDFQYMLAQAKIESALNPDAKASTSSAAGLYQFTRDTWLRTLDAHGDKHGLGWASAAISGGRITDPSLAPADHGAALRSHRLRADGGRAGRRQPRRTAGRAGSRA